MALAKGLDLGPVSRNALEDLRSCQGDGPITSRIGLIDLDQEHGVRLPSKEDIFRAIAEGQTFMLNGWALDFVELEIPRYVGYFEPRFAP